MKVIENFKMSGATYVLMTYFAHDIINYEIELGNWRPLNFEKAPFYFPPPEFSISEEYNHENPIYASKSLGLWKLENIKI